MSSFPTNHDLTDKWPTQTPNNQQANEAASSFTPAAPALAAQALFSWQLPSNFGGSHGGYGTMAGAGIVAVGMAVAAGAGLGVVGMGGSEGGG